MTLPALSVQSPIAYLCAEFGLEAGLPLYAGGLGILAGDILKTAAEVHLPMVGVGLLYKGHGAHQHITAEGWQEDQDHPYDLTANGIFPVQKDGQPLLIHLPLGDTEVTLRVFEKTLGKTVSLILLDPDYPDNPEPIRHLADILYCCETETQLQQAILLGVGGFRALQAMGLSPALYHFNEGRPAFLSWEHQALLHELQHLDSSAAWATAKAKTVYTNHTLVAAGNQTYPLDMVHKYAQPFAQRLGIPVEQLLNQGQADAQSPFSITRFALNSSQRASGVSQRHTTLAKKNWPQYHWDNVTNGVHLATWQRPAFHAAPVDDQELWNLHRQYKHQLMQLSVERTGVGYDPDRLVIAWARRIAGYKQLDRLFSDLDRLESLLRHPARPIQLIVAGKAHPGDNDAKKLLQQVIHFFQDQLNGVAVFIPDYDITLAQNLTAGVDVWLNTPQFGQEASGTSGMKAVSNGVLQATVADGWSAEVDWSTCGWILDPEQPEQTLYDLLETEIAPLFYQRDDRGLPAEWIKRMRASLELAIPFNTQRVLAEYRRFLYEPLLHPDKYLE